MRCCKVISTAATAQYLYEYESRLHMFRVNLPPTSWHRAAMPRYCHRIIISNHRFQVDSVIRAIFHLYRLRNLRQASWAIPVHGMCISYSLQSVCVRLNDSRRDCSQAYAYPGSTFLRTASQIWLGCHMSWQCIAVLVNEVNILHMVTWLIDVAI